MRGNTVTVAAVVALLFIVGGALSVDGKHHHKHKRNINNEKDRVGESARLFAAPGREYHFRYDAQTSSGYAPWISTQRAINRFQASVHIRFHADDTRYATMWMGELRAAQQNDVSASWNVGELQPLHRFDYRMLPVDEDDSSSYMTMSAFADALRTPVEFEYTADGQVGAICFDADELQSTINVKKAMLNLLQVNIQLDNDQQKFAFVESEEFDAGADAKGMLEDGWLESAYTNFETTIEGQCETVYTVTPFSPFYSNDDGMKKKLSKIDESFIRLNVTKSIDFGRCQALVDVGYGMHMEPTANSAVGRQLKYKHLDVPQFDAFASADVPSFDRKTQGASVVGVNRLDRSTVYRYVLVADREALKEDAKQSRGIGIERVEALSEYVFRATGNEEPMQTVAVAQLVFLDSIDNAAQLDAQSKPLPDDDNKEVKKSKKKSANKMDWSVEQKKSSTLLKKLNRKSSAKKLVTLRNVERKCSVADSFATVHSLLYSAEFESLEKRFFMYGEEYTVIGDRKKDEKKSSKNAEKDEKMLKVAALFVDHLPTAEERRKASDAILRRAVNELRLIADAYVRNNDDGAAGINAPRIGAAWTRCVTAVRALSVNGLREMYKMIGGSRLTNELFADALAMAATRNTIDQLTEIVKQSAAAKRPFDESSKVDSKQLIVSELKARQLVKSLGVAGGLPAPSDAQCDAVLRLCKSDALNLFDGLRRDCWLTFGAMVGELQRQNVKVTAVWAAKTRTPTGHMEMMPVHKMELYKQVLLDNVNQAISAAELSKKVGKDSAAKKSSTPIKRIDAVFDTIVALKALGNAQLPTATSALIDIAVDAERPVYARLHAVDALRNVPRENHASLMPIYANQRDRAEIRMAVAALIFTNASPKRTLTDQIAFTLRNERNAEVKAFTYSLLASYARDGRPERRQFMQHLQAALTLYGVDYEAECRRYDGNTGSSMFSHISMPWLTNKKHGLFANIVSIFGSSTTAKQQPLPIHISVELDAMLNGEYARNAAQFSMCQHKLEKLVDQLLSGMEFSAEDKFASEEAINSEKKQKKDVSADGHFTGAISQLSDIFAKLRLKTSGGNKKDGSALPPYAVITIRHSNVDFVVLPLTADTLLDAWKSIDGKPTAGVIRRVRDLVAQSMSFMPYSISSGASSTSDASSMSMSQLNAALPLYYRSARLPTVAGFSLKIVEQTTVFGWLRGGYTSAGARSTQGGKSPLATVSIHANVNVENRQSMHVWLCAECGAAAGVVNQRVAELYAPLTADVGSVSIKHNSSSSAFVDASRKWTVNFRLPERNTRLFGAHTLPVTFVAIGRNSESIEMEETQILFASGEKLENKSDSDEEEDKVTVQHDYSKQHVDPLSGAAEHVASIQLSMSSNNELQIIDARFGDRQFKRLSLPLHIHGFYHPLADASISSASAKWLLSGAAENSLHVDFEPLEGATPKAIRFTWTMKTEYQQPASATAASPLAPPPAKKHDASFSASWTSVRDQLVNFYAKFESAFFMRTDPTQTFDESAEEADSKVVEQKKTETKKLERYADAHAAAHDYLTRHLIRSQQGAGNAPPLYRRSIDVELEALGAVAGSYANGVEAKLGLESICDLRHRACEWRVRVDRTPLYVGERSDWKLDATAQTVYPERIENLAELIELESASKSTRDSAVSQQPKIHFQLFHQLSVEWGSSTSSGVRQSIRLNLLAEPSTKTLRQTIDALKAEQRRADELRSVKAKLRNGGKTGVELRKLNATSTISSLPVLDQFNGVASYQLDGSVQRLVKRVADAFKTKHFWTARVQPLSAEGSIVDGVTDGVVKVSVGVDPFTIRPMGTTTAFANVSWETIAERVRIEAVPLRGFFGYSLMENPKKVADAKDTGALKRFLHSVVSAKAERDGRSVESSSSSSESNEEKEYADDFGSAMCTVGGGHSDDAFTTTIEMFEGAVYDAPALTDCYTVLAKDCGFSPSAKLSNGKQIPRFAVLMSRFGDGEDAQKRIKIITRQQIVAVEPLAVGDARLRVIVEDATQTKTFTHDGAGERQLTEMAERGVELTRRGRTASTRRDQLIYAVPQVLNVEFDGRTVKIQLAEKFQSGACGLCGLDGADDLLIDDIERLFSSYSIRHGKEDCKPIGAKLSSSKFPPKIMKSTALSAKLSYNNEESKKEIEPTEHTAVVEYNQKVCFSLKPVASCPDGWWPTDADGQRDLLKSVNVQFACMERSSIEAKRLRAQARRVGTVRLADYAATYHELMQTPERCVKY